MLFVLELKHVYTIDSGQTCGEPIQSNWDSKETMFILLNCCLESHRLNEYTEEFLTVLLVNILLVWMLLQHIDEIKSGVMNSFVTSL